MTRIKASSLTPFNFLYMNGSESSHVRANIKYRSFVRVRRLNVIYFGRQSISSYIK